VIKAEFIITSLQCHMILHESGVYVYGKVMMSFCSKMRIWWSRHSYDYYYHK